MDAIELLKTQHQEVKGLFKRIEKAEEDEKQDLFEQLADALAVHAAIEEKHFYPATKNARTEAITRSICSSVWSADIGRLRISSTSRSVRGSGGDRGRNCCPWCRGFAGRRCLLSLSR